MARILVNCHGGRVLPANPGSFIVPRGVTVYFYVQDGVILPNGIGWQILNHRLRFLPGNPQGVVSYTFFAGATCLDYYGVPYGGLGVANGIQLEGMARGVPIF